MRRVAAIVVCGFLLIALKAAAIPYSVFVVHCEPTHANSPMWLELLDLVSLAESYRVPLSIDFSPQWAAMILEDERKIEIVERWIGAGHEIGCHHHGYWGTKARGSTWDGYSNTPLSEIDEADRARFLGMMDEYMALMNALPGTRTSGCLGTSNSDDDIDYPCQLRYSTHGQAFDDAASLPATGLLNGCDVIEISHALIASQSRGALRDLYAKTEDTFVFAVVGHVYNFEAFPDSFEQWFAFLASLDPDGDRRSTVSGLLERWDVSGD